MSRIAIVQQAPVFLDRAATLAKAVDAVGEAARGGARLVVFPETFVPGLTRGLMVVTFDDRAGAAEAELIVVK